MKRKQKELPKERNPFVQHLIGKKQGAHGRTKKAERRDDKAALKKSSKYGFDSDLKLAA